MTRIEGRSRFNRTREDVFDFLADPRNEPSYNTMIVGAGKTTPGPIGAGTRFTQQTKTLGRVSEVVIELLECRRPDHLSWHITSSGMEVRGRQDLVEDHGGTEVHWVWDFTARGPLRLLAPLVGLGGRRLERRVWSNMQQYLDSTAPGSNQPAVTSPTDTAVTQEQRTWRSKGAAVTDPVEQPTDEGVR
jgi:carbon monoxide dehydrogenase subunit G